MADLSDVENVLVATLAQAIYPNGTLAASVLGPTCKIYRGWPIPANLDADLKAGTINISVFSQDVEQKTTKYPKEWQEIPVVVPQLTASVSGNTITLAGIPSSPLNVAAIVDGTAYVYPVQPSDSLTRIATGLASLINSGTPATSSGPTITIGSVKELTARIGSIGNVIREVKRQKRNFLISFWCPSAALRDAVVPPCDLILANTDYLTLPDGALGRLLYVRSMVIDRVQNENLYRRDLIYSVEYGTTETMTAPQVVTQKFNLSGGLDPSAPAIKTFSI